MTEKVWISYQDLTDRCKDLSVQLKDHNITKLVAITRGGLFPTLVISQYLDIRDVSTISIQSYQQDHSHTDVRIINDLPEAVYNCSNVLFIDDLFDSGDTIKLIKQRFPEALTLAVYLKENSTNQSNQQYLDFYGSTIEDRWLVFPYEKECLEDDQQDDLDEDEDEDEDDDDSFDDFLDFYGDGQSEPCDKQDTIDSNVDLEVKVVADKLTNSELQAIDIYNELGRNVQAQTVTCNDELKFTLSDQQLSVIRGIENSNAPVCILTGKAGSGKSTIIKCLKQRNPKWPLLATTGKAAVLIGGMTVDSFFCYDRSADKCYSQSRAISNLECCGDSIIIDEASMVGSKMFNYILTYATCFQKKLILIGDWGQACPVQDTWFFDQLPDNYSFFKLTESWRTDQRDFIEALDKVRNGIQDEDVNKLFSTRVYPVPPDDSNCTYLYFTNAKAKSHNEVEIKKLLDQEKAVGLPGTGVVLKTEYTAYKARYSMARIQSLLNMGIYTHNETYTVGAKVLLTKNAREYVNGDSGYIKGFCYDRCNSITGIKVLLERTGHVVTVSKEETAYGEINSKGVSETLYALKGFPIKLGYAITVHKSQGMTLSKVWVDVKDLLDHPTHGILYVALSRVRKLEDLYLSFWKPNIVFMDKSVKNYL